MEKVQHIFIAGSKSIGQYGGYETFVSKLLEQHQNDMSIKYHIACKANGDGCMDESKLDGVTVTKRNEDGSVSEFEYMNAHVFKIKCPNIGPAVAIYYDCKAIEYSIEYCKENDIKDPVFYILACRIGPFLGSLKRKIKAIGGTLALNPDGHEWKRKKWAAPVRAYWKWSEKLMVKRSDIIVCDSVNIEKYIKDEYGHPNTTYIAYGADVRPSILSDDNEKYTSWMDKFSLKSKEYYLIVGRFVPENNYETIIREFMKSDSKKDLVIITNLNDKLKAALEVSLHFSNDQRVKFVGTVYDQELLKKIRENAFAYFHGHEVGGTNPSLLESLGSTELNLLLDVGFNKEVAKDGALYWTKEEGDLCKVIKRAEAMGEEERSEYAKKAKARIKDSYSWEFIASEYKRLWESLKS